MTSNLPQLTEEQRMAALARAMEVRRERKAVKDRLGSGGLSLADALELPEARGIRVSQLLMALPGWGKARVGALMARLGIPDNRRARGLGRRQREALVREVGE